MEIRKAAVYCRGDDIEFQVGLCHAFITDKGLSCYGIYVDSSDSEEPNKALMELISHSKDGCIDVLIVRDYEVLQDDAVKLILSVAELNLPIIGAEDLYCTDENLNLETMKYERHRHTSIKSDDEEFSEDVKNLLERRKWDSYVSGVIPYGFKRSNGKLSPDPVTAPVVRTIFSKALEGERITAIAAWLSQQAIPNPSDDRSGVEGVAVDAGSGDVIHTVPTIPASRWSDNTIRDMLRKEVYTQGVISQETYTKVQERFASNKPNVSKRNRGLYQGLVRCGSCQRAMTYQGTDVNGRKKATYFCKFHTGSNPKSKPLDHMPKVDEEVLKEEVLRQCNDYIKGFSREKLNATIERFSKKESAARETIIELGTKLLRKENVSKKKYQGLWTSWEYARRRHLMAIAYSFLLAHRFEVYQFGQMNQNDLETELKLFRSISVYPDGKIVVNFIGDEVLAR